MDFVKAGSVDISVYFRLRDATTGLAKTGLVFNSAGAVARYTRNRATPSTITLATLAAADSAHSDGGFKEVDGTNCKGLYRLDLPDAAVAAGSRHVMVSLEFDGVIEETKEIGLTGCDLTDGVRLGLTALPNAAAEAAGGLYTRGSGAGQINQAVNGKVDANVTHWRDTATPAEHTAGYPIVTVKDGTGAGEIDTASGKVLLADGAHGGTAAVMTLERVIIAATTTNEPGVKVTGNGTGDGVKSISGGSGGSGIKAEGQAIGFFAAGVGTNATGMIVAGNGTGDGLAALKGATGQDIDADITGTIIGSLSGSVGSIGAGGIAATSFQAGAIDAAAIADDAIDAGAIAAGAADKIIQSVNGTADSGTTTTLVDAARTETDTDYWKGAVLLMTSGNLAGQRRRITAFNPATDTITVDSAFTQAVGTQNYLILRTAYNEAPAAGSGDWSAAEKEQIRDALGVDGTKTAATGGDVQDIQTRLPAALVAGRMSSDAVAISGSTAAADSVEANIGNLDAAVSTRATPAQVNTEVDTALADVNLDHLVGTASGIPAVPSGTYLDQVMDDGTAVYDRTTDSLQAIRDKETDVETDTQDIQSRLPAALVAGRMSSDAVAISGSSGAADSVEANIGNLDAAITTRATPAQVRTESNGAIADNHLDHLLATDTPAPLPGAAGSILADMLRDDGGVWSYNANALELAPTGGGGGGAAVILGAIQTTVRPGNRLSSPIALEMFVDEAKTFALAVLDANGAPVSLLGKILRFVVFDTNVPTVGKFKCETGGDGITISGTSNEIALVAVSASKANFVSRDLGWALWDVAADAVLLWGPFAIAPARKVVP